MALTEKQRKRIAYMKDGYLVDKDEVIFQTRFDRAFAAMSSPEEFFLFASESHPNQEPDEWRKILNHTLCDQGTALLVYWRCSPITCYKARYDFFVESSINEDYWNFIKPGFEFLKEIEKQYGGSGYPSRIVRFDPNHFKGRSFFRAHSVEDLSRVPILMREPSEGESVAPLQKQDFDWGNFDELF